MMIPSTGITSLDIICGTLACVLVYRLVTRMARIPKGLRLPPGPPGMLVIGNVADLPKGPIWKTFDRWAKEYGEIVYIKLLGQTIIILNSLDTAQDLLEKRSAIYSDRTHSTMLVELLGFGWNTGIMRYGEWWRRHRRMFHQYFHSGAVGSYQDVQTKQARAFLKKLHSSPDDFKYHIRHLAAATIMEIVYGISILPKEDPYVEIAEAAGSATSELATPGNFLVDILPFLKYVPEWVPGADFQRKAREWSVPVREMAELPLKAVKDALDAGTARPSIAATLLEDLSRRTDVPADEETVIRNVTGIAYAGGAETTVSNLLTFVLAMVLYPAVQRKAQAELDAVIGNRLPVLEDRDCLPYVTALCKEVHRWHPAFPFGVGHRLMEDDVYGEYFIPKGSIVFGNAWSILRDENIYGSNVDEFEPERFLRPGAIDPIGQFGFGRRICPGRYLVDNSIFIATASILKVFDISNKRDNNGNEITFEPVYPAGLITQPESFPCAITPRSLATQELFLDQADE